MKRLITIIFALIMTLFTAPNRSAEQPPVTAVKTPQTAIVTQVKRKHRVEHKHARKRNVRAHRATSRARTGRIRKSGTGCVYQINDHLWEGSFYPRLPTGKRKKFNVYAETREHCEAKLAEMIAEKKAEIAEEKAKRKEGAE